ncbi:MAG TPA: TolC family protein [Vicinamibacteria bacterium]|nr:TolC family protein [Vicinamibacteria bacterium]
MKWFAGAVLLCVLAAEGAAAQKQEVTEELPPGDEPEFYAPEDSLRDYVMEALEKNPAVRETFVRYRSALERVPQVSTLPDPMFTFGQAIRRVETRVGPQLNTFVFSQAFPWFGKLDLRGQVATQEALSMYQMFLASQREAIAQVKRAYYELTYVDRALVITREEQSLLEHYEALAQTRYATGQGLQQAVIKIQAEITRVLNRLDILGQQRESLVARLNTLMDRPPTDALPPTLPLSAPEVTLDLESLYELGDQNRQELKAVEERIERSERAIELAKKSSWPDFFIGVGVVNVGLRTDPAGLMLPPPDNGKNAVSVSAGINIPIWRDKYDAAVQEAGETLLAERSGYASVRNEMEFSIRDLVVRIETAREQIRLFEGVLIPQAEETLRATEAAYETGQLGVLDLLDGERVLLNVRLGNARYYSDLLGALANLERAVGTRFPG